MKANIFVLGNLMQNTFGETVFCIILMYCFSITSSSYLHCEWATEQQLLKDKRIQQKIKRFKLRQAQRAHFLADVRKKPSPHLVFFIEILRMVLGMWFSGRIFA